MDRVDFIAAADALCTEARSAMRPKASRLPSWMPASLATAVALALPGKGRRRLDVDRWRRGRQEAERLHRRLAELEAPHDLRSDFEAYMRAFAGAISVHRELSEALMVEVKVLVERFEHFDREMGEHAAALGFGRCGRLPALRWRAAQRELASERAR